MKQIKLIILLLSIISQTMFSQPITQWRGPDRNGVFPATNLLKSWPEKGPELRWMYENLDKGYSSVSVTDEHIYI